MLQPYAYELACIHLAAELRTFICSHSTDSVQSNTQPTVTGDNAHMTNADPETTHQNTISQILWQFMGTVIKSVIGPALKSQLHKAINLVSPGLDLTLQPSMPTSIPKDSEEDELATVTVNGINGNLREPNLSDPKAIELVVFVSGVAKAHTDLHLEEYRVKPRNIHSMIKQREVKARQHQAACEWLSAGLSNDKGPGSGMVSLLKFCEIVAKIQTNEHMATKRLEAKAFSQSRSCS